MATDQTRVNFRWGRRQVDVVKRAAGLAGVPYQSWIKLVAFRQAVADLKAAAEAGADPAGARRRKWTQGVDGVWSSDDGIQIDGSAGHYFPTQYGFSLVEIGTAQDAMAAADRHWPLKTETSTDGD